ncbi:MULTISPECIES: NAD(P)/FAD-dependent oxidoreductase [Micrococcus]|uniref:NAD(P)/FAD-dependent oxidoreductase n=1 Tax=Micrococcus antarcticus TaxID=86171 RepID=UPI0038509097
MSAGLVPVADDGGAPGGASASVLVLGGGLAGFSLVRELRRRGFAGALTIADPEGLPYDRPPLSKDYLTGETDGPRLLLAPPSWFAEHGVEVVTARAEALEPGGADVRHRVRLNTGEAREADVVVLATGGRVRPLAVPGADDARLITLRTRADADALVARLHFGARVAVIGGGFTGAEAASSARAAFADVTLVTSTETPSLTAVGPAITARLHRMHAENGVELEVGRVARIEHADEAVDDPGGGLPTAHRVHLEDGRTVDADVVVLATGTVPETALAEKAGIETADGVLVDAAGRTSVPGILAVGDVARLRDSAWPASRHWEPAMQAGVAAAAALMGEEPAAPGAPWFWSDRHGAHVEAVGDMALPDGGRHVHREVRGRTVASFALAADGTMRGAASVDDPMAVKAARRIIDRAIRVDPEALADPAVPVRSLARG